jgi:hypothetical protein
MMWGWVFVRTTATPFIQHACAFVVGAQAIAWCNGLLLMGLYDCCVRQGLLLWGLVVLSSCQACWSAGLKSF